MMNVPIVPADSVGLIVAAGRRVQSGRGSRRRFELRDRVATFHEPYPGKMAVKGAVADIREFLDQAGMRP